MAYKGSKRVEMDEFMLRGPAQEWYDFFRESRLARDVITWEDFQTSFLTEYQSDSF